MVANDKDFETTIEQESSAVSTEELRRRIRWSAMELLSRREHSKFELRQKLSRRYPEAHLITELVIDELEMESLQSDCRYAEAYVRMRHRKGYGPIRIALELKERGVSGELVSLKLQDSGFDWFEAAHQAMMKKFPKSFNSYADRAKCQRFLQYRGFDFEQIQNTVGR